MNRENSRFYQTCNFTYLSVYLVGFLYVCPSIHCPSVYLSVCLSVCLSLCFLSVCSTVRLSFCLSVRLFVCLSACVSVCLSGCLSKLDSLNPATLCINTGARKAF